MIYCSVRQLIFYNQKRCLLLIFMTLKLMMLRWVVWSGDNHSIRLMGSEVEDFRYNDKTQNTSVDFFEAQLKVCLLSIYIVIHFHVFQTIHLNWNLYQLASIMFRKYFSRKFEWTYFLETDSRRIFMKELIFLIFGSIYFQDYIYCQEHLFKTFKAMKLVLFSTKTQCRFRDWFITQNIHTFYFHLQPMNKAFVCMWPRRIHQTFTEECNEFIWGLLFSAPVAARANLLKLSVIEVLLVSSSTSLQKIYLRMSDWEFRFCIEILNQFL